MAGLSVPVLLRGETGTGKEPVARALHDASPRRGRPYLAVNMAAVPATLAAAELFRAARGAYTGADRKRDGFFLKADAARRSWTRWRRFLARSSPCPSRLENREIQPVGGDEPRRVDVRLVAATDADLEGAVAAGRFRAPLLHRLAGYEIRIPPLRERRDDFGRLFLHFLRLELEELGEGHRLATSPEDRSFIPAALMARLAVFDWPGNVRQLRNLVRQVVLAGRDAGEPGMWLQAERLFQEAGARKTRPEDSGSRPAAVPEGPEKGLRKAYRSPDDVTEEELLAALRANRWRLQRVAAEASDLPGVPLR